MEDLELFVDLNSCTTPTVLDFDVSLPLHPVESHHRKMDWYPEAHGESRVAQDKEMEECHYGFVDPMKLNVPSETVDEAENEDREFCGPEDDRDEELEESEYERPQRSRSRKAQSDDLLDIKSLVEQTIQEENERLEKSLADPALSLKDKRQLKNKISARQFRLRRKEYISTLENEIRRLRLDNSDLRKKGQLLESKVSHLSKKLAEATNSEPGPLELSTDDTVMIRIPPLMRPENIPANASTLAKSLAERKKRIDKLTGCFQSTSNQRSKQQLHAPPPQMMYPPPQFLSMFPSKTGPFYPPHLQPHPLMHAPMPLPPFPPKVPLTPSVLMNIRPKPEKTETNLPSAEKREEKVVKALRPRNACHSPTSADPDRHMTRIPVH